MKKKRNQILTTLTISTIMGVSLFCTMPGAEQAHAATDIVINETNFPDEVFRNFVTDNFDSNNNGVLEESEINAITEVDVDKMGISDLKGIEYFSKLRNLSCKNNNLTALDVSQNTALQFLICTDNQLTTLDITRNTALYFIECGFNNITTLDVSSNPELIRISCENTLLTGLDVSNNPKLYYLSVAQTNVETIDVSQNPKLDLLFCGGTKIQSLDLSHNPKLRELRCGMNAITELDVSNHTALEMLWCEDNSFASLDLSNNTALNKLQHWSSISAPLHKDGKGYSLDLSAFSLDKAKVGNVSNGSYNSADGKIYLDTPLAAGDTLTYEYATGFGNDKMTVTVKISEVDSDTTTTEAASEAGTTSPAADNTSTPKTGDATAPLLLLILGLCSVAGILFTNKKIR